jgi:hypothetical protein
VSGSVFLRSHGIRNDCGSLSMHPLTLLCSLPAAVAVGERDAFISREKNDVETYYLPSNQS